MKRYPFWRSLFRAGESDFYRTCTQDQLFSQSQLQLKILSRRLTSKAVDVQLDRLAADLKGHPMVAVGRSRQLDIVEHPIRSVNRAEINIFGGRMGVQKLGCRRRP